ncbi:MAG: basic amino acid/polyamine antiporter, family [Clostridia bacterium]|nr:basic amino acid/polyamine antiporter, family [Clostridia bacterium]
MAAATEKLELRREVTVWGSYMWGYADVGADIYAALGLVMLWAKGATGLAFALAGLVYIMIGLAYTELAATYPVAGGGQFFTLRGLGDFWGFVAGSALLLDYTIDIALFATASAGYINFFLPYLFGIDVDSLAISIGPLHHVNLVWMAEALVLVIFLIALNIRGMRESSLLNEVLGAIDILTESTIIVFGFLFAWRPELLAHQWLTQFPTFKEFAYGSSLAIISFVGLESISQAAQETKRPATVVPRTSVGLIFTVFIFATAFSTMSLGVLPWQDIAEAVGDPVATLAHAIPFIGIIAGPFAALLGATILLISANSGVMSASRLTFAMSQFHFISDWFNAVHPRFRTPYRTILVFSGIGVLQIVLSFLTPNAMDTLGNMYAFGATTGYILVFLALIKLRFTDPYAPRPYKVPLNIKINYHGRTVEFPLLGVIGTLGISTILFEVILTHAIGRIAGPAWILLCFIYYVYYRRKHGFPVLGNIPRDWEGQQLKVLEAAEEYDLLEEYKQALAERDRKEAVAHGS